MRRSAGALFALFIPLPVAAQVPVTQVNLTYDTYAASLEVMRMHVFFGIGPWNYRINLNYQTTGLVGFFYRGQQVNTVRGTWDNGQANPLEFFGEGTWRGKQRRTLIDYDSGIPDVKVLEPPQDSEREPVPRDMQLHTMDTLSALAQLMRKVELQRTCQTTVHTYDGRRVLEIEASNAGTETLTPSHDSSFSGPAVRCDFEGRELAGFPIGQDDPDHRRPLRGSAWLAEVPPDPMPLPVRISFQTRWFGEATMYLTSVNHAKPEDVPHN
ncbi:MAG TPA: DUF3108 domain-containing protein [Acetobacteraceae bacterium]|nr:DUF3108 domain-containing protein [Acetobacteraceae bacterium]